MSITLETGLRDVGESVPRARLPAAPDRYEVGKSNGSDDGDGLELGEPAPIRPATTGELMKEF